MNHRRNHLPAGDRPRGAAATRGEPPAATIHSGPRLRPARWLAGSVAAVLWLLLVYGLPLHALRNARQLARTEVARLLQTDKPDTIAILTAFDRATEEILFAASGPYFILAVTTVFLVAHLVEVKRRLDAAELHLRALRDVVLGVEGISLK